MLGDRGGGTRFAGPREAYPRARSTVPDPLVSILNLKSPCILSVLIQTIDDQ